MPRALQLRHKKQNNRKRMLRCVTHVTSEGKRDNVTMYSSNESFTHFKMRAICSFAHSPTLARRAVASAIAAVNCAYVYVHLVVPIPKIRKYKGVISGERGGRKIDHTLLVDRLGKVAFCQVNMSKRKSCCIQLKNCEKLLLLSCGRA
jgi:hypothetical protein